MIDKVRRPAQLNQNNFNAAAPSRKNAAERGAFGDLLTQQLNTKEQGAQTVNFSKHALARAEERGIELTPTLMDKLADSVEKAQEKGATNILAFDDSRAFIINIPCSRVITTMSQEEMKENIFTNIDGAVLL